jgi:hypothetical protein
MSSRRKSRKNKFYAVAQGAERAIYTDWNSCKTVVNGVACAKYKSFATLAGAVEFMNENDLPHELIKLEIMDKSNKRLSKRLSFNLSEYCCQYGVDIPPVTEATCSSDQSISDVHQLPVAHDSIDVAPSTQWVAATTLNSSDTNVTPPCECDQNTRHSQRGPRHCYPPHRAPWYHEPPRCALQYSEISRRAP